MYQPLEGIRVLDLTHMLAGPLATHQLCMLGAQVIKVEPPKHGDVMRWSKDGAQSGLSSSFAAINPGKLSLSIDLKKPQGRAVLLELCKSADVLVENFKPGTMSSLGLDYETVKNINPDIIYCSISGYGQKHPLRDRPAYDHVIQAITGMASINGEENTPPIKVGFPIVDTATGIIASSAIITALLGKSRKKQNGRYLDISMMESAAHIMCTMITSYLKSKNEPLRPANRGFTGSPGCDTFETRDGYIAIGANKPAQFRALCDSLEIPDIAQDASLVDLSSPSFAKPVNSEKLREALSCALGKRSADEWEFILNRANIPAAKLNSIGEFSEKHLPHLQNILVIFNGQYTLNSDPSNKIADSKEFNVHKLGQDNESILINAGYSKLEIDKLISNKILYEGQNG